MGVEFLASQIRTGKSESPWTTVPAGAVGLSVKIDPQAYADDKQGIQLVVYGRTAGGEPVNLGGGGYLGGDLLDKTAIKDPFATRRLTVGIPNKTDEVLVELTVDGIIVCDANVEFT